MCGAISPVPTCLHCVELNLLRTGTVLPFYLLMFSTYYFNLYEILSLTLRKKCTLRMKTAVFWTMMPYGLVERY
jgi:hypothetical protein